MSDETLELFEADGQTTILNGAGSHGQDLIRQLHTSEKPFYIKDYFGKYNVPNKQGDCVVASVNAFHLILQSDIKCVPKIIGAWMTTDAKQITHAYVQIKISGKLTLILDASATHAGKPARLVYEDDYNEKWKPKQIEALGRSDFMNAYKHMKKHMPQLPDHFAIAQRLLRKTISADKSQGVTTDALKPIS